MTEKSLVISLCIVGVLLIVAISAYIAYKTVFSSEIVCQKREKIQSDNEISIDDICNEYLKLTNDD